MFSENSRYQHLQTATHRQDKERNIPYVKRRFLPRGEDMPLLAEIAISAGDRLDLITARTLGDPQQFWRICDANNAMHPRELVVEIGRRIRVPIPQFEDIIL